MKNIYFLILPDFHLLDLAGPCQAFDEANKLGCKYKLHYIGFSQEVLSHQGIHLSTLSSPPTRIPDNSIIIACATRYSEPMYSDKESLLAIEWLRSQYSNKSIFMSICTGAFLLGKAGILNGRQCTTHHAFTTKLSAQFPKAEVIKDRIFIQSKNVFSSAGVTAAIDLSLEIIEQGYSTKISIDVARDLLVHRRRMSNDAQLSKHMILRNHISPLIHSIQDYISVNFSQNIKIKDIAFRNNISTRHLQRKFKLHTGTTISEYTNRMQLEEAHNLIRSGHTVESSAFKVGFKQPSSLRNLWKKYYNNLPSQVKPDK